MSAHFLINKTVFLFSPEQWSSMKLSKHHYALELAKLGNKVYFIEPAKKGGSKVQVDQLQENLYRVNYPLKARGLGKIPRFLYEFLVKFEVNLLLRHIKVQPDILWCFDPLKLSHLKYFKTGKRIFHPVDHFKIEFPNSTQLRIDACFSTMKTEVLRLIELGYKAYFLNHGLSSIFISFSKKRLKELEQTNDTNTVSGNLQIGFAGNLLGEAPDRTVMQKVILENTDCVFHFWGNYEKSTGYLSLSYHHPEFISFLKSQPNVKLYGAVETTDLAMLMQDIDIFWICWKTGSNATWSKHTNPHKIVEYLSTGKPVVSHFIESYKGHNLLEMIENDDGNNMYPDLFKKVKEKYQMHNSLVRQEAKKRISFALDNTYEKHIEKVGRKIFGKDN